MVYEVDGRTFHGIPKVVKELYINNEKVEGSPVSNIFLVTDDRERTIEIQAVLKDEVVESMVNSVKNRAEENMKLKLDSGAIFTGKAFATSVSVEPTGLVDSKYVNADYVIAGELTEVPRDEIPTSELTEKEQLEKLKKNILNLSWSLQDAPFHGVSKESENAIGFAINKILKDTGITIESLLAEGKSPK